VKDYVCDDDYKPLIPNGTYTAQCIKYDNKFVLGKTKKLFLNFVILSEGEYHGKRIFQAFNMPYNGRIKTGSKYYKTWCMVNRWQKPSRNAKMSAWLFLNKIYKIKTRTVKPLHNKKEMPESFWYSVVDEIIGFDTT
jgi:hypothetical protein